MDPRLRLLSDLARPAKTRVVLLVLDGVGDIRTPTQPQTPLEAARTPHLDALAARASLGRLVPAGAGVAPGSGPGHLALFGYDPARPETAIGRGILEAYGLGIEVPAGAIAARGNFATADGDGKLTDRRAGRISTDECRRLAALLQEAVREVTGLRATVHAGEGHRFVLVLEGEDLSPALADTDPQRLGVPPLDPAALEPAAEATATRLRELIVAMERRIAGEPRANRVLLRGFSGHPELPALPELYGLRCGAFAGYPLYRGVAAACGMESVDCGKELPEVLAAVREAWKRFDLFFLHYKAPDQAGEDGDFAAKVEALERADRALPELRELAPDVVAVTGDHSTPVPCRSHSWHPVPVLLAAPHAFIDEGRRFTELEAARGVLGTLPSRDLMALLLAHAGRLGKLGA